MGGTGGLVSTPVFLSEECEPTMSATKKILFLLMWTGVFVKLFVFDFDTLLFSKLPPNIGDFCIRFKFLMVLIIAIIFSKVLGTKRFFMNLAYLAIFPFILLLWYIPKLVFRSTVGMIVASSVILSCIGSLRFRLVNTALAIMGVFLVFMQWNDTVTLTAMIYLLLFLLLHFVTKFMQIFRPARLFKKVNRGIDRYWSLFKEKFIMKHIREVKEADPEAKDYRKKRITNFTNLLLLNRLLLHISAKFRQFHESRIIVFYFIGGLALTFGLTIFIFAVEYYGLASIHPNSFTGIENMTFLHYFYLSFTGILTASFGDVIPNTDYARLLVSLEVLSGLLIGVILFFIFTNIILMRYQEELQVLIDRLAEEGRAIEAIVQSELNLKLIDIQSEIEKDSPDQAKVLEKLSLYGKV